MKNRIKNIKKIKTKQQHSLQKAEKNPFLSEFLTNNSIDKKSFFYNFNQMGILIEILIGAILGLSICFGFVFCFFIFGGNIFISFGFFLVIIIVAIFLVLLLKYMFLLVMLKIKEIKLLEKIANG